VTTQWTSSDLAVAVECRYLLEDYVRELWSTLASEVW
jgi:hypothetical protein